jgi:hypothetical protein
MIGSLTWYSLLMPYRLVALDAEPREGGVYFRGGLEHSQSGELVSFGVHIKQTGAAHSLEAISLAAIAAVRKHKEQTDGERAASHG